MLLLYLQVFKCMRLLTKAIKNMRKDFSMCLTCFNASTFSLTPTLVHMMFYIRKVSLVLVNNMFASFITFVYLFQGVPPSCFNKYFVLVWQRLCSS